MSWFTRIQQQAALAEGRAPDSRENHARLERLRGRPARDGGVQLPRVEHGLGADNNAVARVLLAALTDVDRVWLMRELGVRVSTVHPSRGLAKFYADYRDAGRNWAGLLASAFTDAGLWLRDTALQALIQARPVEEEDAALIAKLTERASGLPALEPYSRGWRVEFTAEANRQAVLSFPALPAILAGMPLVTRYVPVEGGRVTMWEHRLFLDPWRDRPSGRPATETVENRREAMERYTFPSLKAETQAVSWRDKIGETNNLYSLGMAATAPRGKALNELTTLAGVKPGLREPERRAAIGKVLGMYASENNVPLAVTLGRDSVESGEPILSTLNVVTGSGGRFADSIRKLVRHPVKWMQSLGEELGKMLQDLGEEILRWSRVPVLGTWLVDASFGPFIGELLMSTGNMLVGHSVKDFDSQRVMGGLARSLLAAGQAGAVVAAFLPPPFNLIVAAIAGVMIALGKLIAAKIAQTKAKQAAQTLSEKSSATQAGPEPEPERSSAGKALATVGAVGVVGVLGYLGFAALFGATGKG